MGTWLLEHPETKRPDILTRRRLGCHDIGLGVGLDMCRHIVWHRACTVFQLGPLGLRPRVLCSPHSRSHRCGWLVDLCAGRSSRGKVVPKGVEELLFTVVSLLLLVIERVLRGGVGQTGLPAAAFIRPWKLLSDTSSISIS